MNIINPVNTALPAANVSAAQEVTRLPALNEMLLVDRVEISELAHILNKRELDINDIRVDKVLAIREAIANGTYITDDKISITVNRLLDVLMSAGRVL